MTSPYFISSYSFNGGCVHLNVLGCGRVIVYVSVSLPDFITNVFFPVTSCTLCANPPEECTGTLVSFIVSSFFVSAEPAKNVDAEFMVTSLLFGYIISRANEVCPINRNKINKNIFFIIKLYQTKFYKKNRKHSLIF